MRYYLIFTIFILLSIPTNGTFFGGLGCGCAPSLPQPCLPCLPPLQLPQISLPNPCTCAPAAAPACGC
uniref:IGFBP N-terminal domain-containing protein n=1 Tax=Parastrongyloides trichosuri TaxID=131310 RepID=A0A0N4ZRM4_PARTI